MALHFHRLPTELDGEEVQDYLYALQQRSKTPSQTYFKHTVYGLRFLLKTEDLPYEYLKLPSIKHEQKLPVILSREEIWRRLHSAKQVIAYLGRYTHKVAISNHRVQNITSTHTSFTYKDYKDGGKTKEMALTNQEFVRRFAMHILLKRFVRIRHCGILSSSWKRGKLQQLQTRLRVVKPEVKPITMLRKCPCCKTGTLITIEVFGKRGSPSIYIVEKQPAAQA